jgi:hypothetical protein
VLLLFTNNIIVLSLFLSLHKKNEGEKKGKKKIKIEISNNNKFVYISKGMHRVFLVDSYHYEEI